MGDRAIAPASYVITILSFDCADRVLKGDRIGVIKILDLTPNSFPQSVYYGA